MPENMPKLSMLPMLNHFQYAPSFTGTYQHLFICHLSVQLIFSILHHVQVFKQHQLKYSIYYKASLQ